MCAVRCALTLTWKTFWELFRIPEPGPETAAIDRVKAERIRLPGIGSTGRSADQRLVVEHDIVMIKCRPIHPDQN
jgi:hypothetical protein